MSNKDGLKDFLHEHRELGFERRIKRMREDYLSEYKEGFVELLVFFIAIETDFPNNFKELEGLANEENKEGVAVAKEAFGGNLAEALCSIKRDVPDDLINDEYATVLAKFGKSIYLNDAKQDWYKEKGNIIPKEDLKKTTKSFDVKEKEYYRYPINFETYKSGKTLIIKEGIEIRK